MGFWYLMAAAALATLGAGFHGILGRRLYLGEIRKGGLPESTVTLSTVSWDMFTVLLLVSALTLVNVAYNPSNALMVHPVVMMNLMGAALFIGLGFAGHKMLIRLPGAYLMGATGGLALLGL
ncbi:hypothetical protein N9Y14_01270 [Alphaproteobacteria bacterium]|jgi:hypothetical protein|nr:hypothetical protein [Rhodobiaceae bacterium]MDA8666242.1 hypothetical protein [Alphaproteobacteria bacterium]OUV19851.1 MAG: hypothetical protein CBC55_10855 [Gammaproteobacteria bacterium TMED95]RPF95270.1 MAG: hypothetical protein CBD22_003745 [Rhizobiales bacterium TMED162]MDA8780294.1 hypothetical protein [Alphaproteobacteria bacterium]